MKNKSNLLFHIQNLSKNMKHKTKTKENGILLLFDRNLRFWGGDAKVCLWSEHREIIQYSGGSCHLSTILLKNSHLFKIAKLVISFCFKIFFNSTILNICESLSGMVDHVTCPPWRPYNFSKIRGFGVAFIGLRTTTLTLICLVWNDINVPIYVLGDEVKLGLMWRVPSELITQYISVGWKIPDFLCMREREDIHTRVEK